MMKAREGASYLLVGEVAVPDEFNDAGGPADAFWRPAEGLEGDEDFRADAGGEPMKRRAGSGLRGFGGGGVRRASSTRVLSSVGMRWGRLAGLEKKAKTSSTG